MHAEICQCPRCLRKRLNAKIREVRLALAKNDALETSDLLDQAAELVKDWQEAVAFNNEPIEVEE